MKLLDILKEIITDTKVFCNNCDHSWKYADGGDDPYICHECGTDNEDTHI